MIGTHEVLTELLRYSLKDIVAEAMCELADAVTEAGLTSEQRQRLVDEAIDEAMRQTRRVIKNPPTQASADLHLIVT